MKRSRTALVTNIKRNFLSKSYTLSGAESITGGGISYALSSIPGASAFFLGSAVTYAYTAKERVLRLDPEILHKFTVYSDETAFAMASAAQTLFQSTLAFAVTGLAGPSDDGSKLPIGTVFLCVIGKNRIRRSRRHIFEGTRTKIRDQVVDSMLELIHQAIQEF